MDEQFSEIFKILSSTFGLPPYWFEFPTIIFYFFIPLLALIFVWYSFLQKRIRFARGRSGINFGLALILSFFSTPIISFFSPQLVVPSLVAIGILIMGRFSFKRIFLAVVVAGIIWWGYPILMSLLTI